MKVTGAEVFVLGDPAPSGKIDARTRELPFLRIHTDAGLTGLSEMFHVPGGVARTVFAAPDAYLGKLLVNQDPTSPERVSTMLYDAMMHNNRRGWLAMCIGAADVALWDIYGKAVGRPVFELLGGAERSRSQRISVWEGQAVTPYATVVSTDWDEPSMIQQQLDRVGALRDRGFRAFKIEPMNSTPGAIVKLARLARAELGPDCLLAVDVGYLWNDVPTAARVCNQLAEYEIAFVETPFPVDAIEAYARLAELTTVPLAAGEHSVTRWEFLDLMDRGRVQVVQPYMTTCGGLTEAKRIVELAKARGVSVWPGNWSTQVLGAATVHLALHSPITPAIEYHPWQVSWSPLQRAIGEIAFPVVDGRIHAPTAPGIGIDLPSELVAAFRLA
ncbi:MAG: mandelate racemase/muconate lactonizing enzyme family protein [Actinobacteria bacterium]|nr:mandelate racemase/muconate lactonizing enzyme family protein [Actinomycetota bacterium]